MNASTLSLAQSPGLAADVNSLNNLKFQAGKDQKGALKEAARQFEALFMRELLKSMREATMKSGLMENDSGNLGAELLDQQYATQMTGMPGGLSAMIERQLSQQMTPAGTTSSTPLNSAFGTPGAPASFRPAVPAPAGGANTVSPAAQSTVDRVGSASSRAQQFVARLGSAARDVAAEVGIPAGFMLGQAGHETGWGRSEIKHADGSNSFNVFGIKAGKGWKGKVAEVTTTEYVNGQPQKIKARFRAYDSYQDAFRDYARLIGNSPRYAQVMDSLHSVQSFASGLQRAGYATDPQYATKLSRAINTALTLQRVQT